MSKPRSKKPVKKDNPPPVVDNIKGSGDPIATSEEVTLTEAERRGQQ